MASLIRVLLITPLLFGCSSFFIKNIEPKYGRFHERALDKDIELDQLKLISFNSKDFVLAYPNLTETFKNKKIIIAEDIFFDEDCGKLVKSVGLNNDFEILEYDCDILKNYPMAVLNTEYSSVETLIKFSNPKTTYLTMKLTYKVINDNASIYFKKNQIKNLVLIEEAFDVKKIGWSGKNYYWLNENNNTIKTIQFNEPGFNYIKIQSVF
tara:strand:- start:240 stop:869 length:630 start_codon:yes stop_codon:yes gene_type:complete